MRAHRVSFWLLWCLTLAGLNGACTRYSLSFLDVGAERPVVVRIDEPLREVNAKLRDYLTQRQRLETANDTPLRDGSVNLVQRWVRDTSLRYYNLKMDTRERAITDWKAQWHLRPVSPTQTEVSLAVLELLFVGPARDAGPRPEAQVSVRSDARRAPAVAFENSDWFESNPDNLRAALEMRRFWNQVYAGRPLPDVLASINVPVLAGPPLAKLFEERRRWKAWRRSPSF